ncbi:MAG: ATP-dependent DNA helicase RecG [Oscillospiraceae bacterium]|jgi:ATP-dependent DNA helicase RecG|nr:ATP-dependent DNA helicase RecG [Oscillospiraceae bacterium]
MTRVARLDTDVRYIKGVGEKRAALMAKLGIRTLGELVRHYPRAYEDRTVFMRVGELKPGDAACVRATVTAEPVLRHVRAGLDILTFTVADDSGAMGVVFFNQPFVKDSIAPGRAYTLYGKVAGTPRRPEMQNPVIEQGTAQGRGALTGAIVPVYALTAGISHNAMAGAVRQGLILCGDELPDALPKGVRERHGLAHARFSYENIHFPADFEALEIARRRLIFEELFTLSVSMKMMRDGRAARAGIAFDCADAEGFFSALPFVPTRAQRRAVAQAAEDMSSGRAMNRLVQGDVGSGKTVVAAACCYLAWRSGRQSAMMAPTELLAEQHYRSLTGIFGPMGVKTGLLTGGMRARSRRETLEMLARGDIDVIIGTHALIGQGVNFHSLALVITDEQHRFGVRQRSELTAKGECAHVLVMSATPIPRTLALMIYGDLDVSVVDEMPPGRERVDTFAVGERYRERIYEFVRKLTGQGRQVYIVCPAVDEPEEGGDALKAAADWARELAEDVFTDRRVALVHGKMKARAREAVMSQFREGGIDILVATTVIEVGVDVPNAALIIVENADRFGLSQLHQLRGRVGRGEHKSYCVLFEGAGGEAARERLRVMTQYSDGFKISEQDLALRGPGDFFGSRQHGLPDLKIASLVSDMDTLETAQGAARAVVEDDPGLERPENAALARSVSDMFARVSGDDGVLS